MDKARYRVVAALAGAVLAVVAAPPAVGATPRAALTPEAAQTLADRLGAAAAGSYADSSGHQVVAVTSAAAAARVTAAGGTARRVKYDMAALQAGKAAIDRAPRTAGTAWVVDPVSNQVVISVDQSVTGARLARVQALSASLGGVARVEHVAGTFETRIAGGDAIYVSNYRCSLGFNVSKGGQHYFLTAGHCGNIQGTWYSDGAHTKVLGSVAGSSFPGNDYALIKYSSSSTPAPGAVDLYNGSTYDIARAGTAYVGEGVTRSGSTSGLHSGKVEAVNASVSYSEGTVTGLIETNVCAEPGDSGGSLFTGNVALGLTSGGSGNCTSGGTTFFQPVTEALSAYGVSIY